MPILPSQPCPCGSDLAYKHCCQALIIGQLQARSAQQLMRSRYTAHVAEAIDYLIDTWDPGIRDAVDASQVASWARQSQWLGLEVLNCKKGQPGDTEGWVEFVAHYRQGDRLLQHREKSYFRYFQDLWYFVSGELQDPVKIGRNQACICGSGKKYKRCCGR